LSYLENREWETIEQKIAEAEATVTLHQRALEDPAVTRDGASLAQAYAALEQAQRVVDALYERWAELEAKIS
jgi:ATP-binding cassette subfamily F protein uup